MPQRSSTDPSAPQLLDLHPSLQATLRCMDVRLDEELARYRRDRRRSPIRPQSVATAAPTTNPTADEVDATADDAAMLAIAPGFGGELDGEDAPTTMAAAGSEFDPMAPPPDAEEYDDYLESSEHLLQSLADDEAELRTEPAPRMLDTLLTPLGIGSMVLLLLSSVTLGYVITHPNSLPFMAAESGEDAIDGAGNDLTLPEEDAAVSDAPFTPDLSSQEFRDLNLDTLSTLPEDAVDGSTDELAGAAISEEDGASDATNASETTATTPTAQTAPAPQPQTQATAPAARPAPAPAPAATAPAPRPQPASSPSPAPVVTAAPSPPPQSTPAPSPVAAAPSAAPETYYYVVTDYTGDAALGAAQDAVPDAYVRNLSGGAVVQFGAFSEEGRARALSQDLQNQGISARIQRIER
ncbi:MAG: SPOR domain-containing protein [Cyanobacteria bacterium J06638_22]